MPANLPVPPVSLPVPNSVAAASAALPSQRLEDLIPVAVAPSAPAHVAVGAGAGVLLAGVVTVRLGRAEEVRPLHGGQLQPIHLLAEVRPDLQKATVDESAGSVGTSTWTASRKSWPAQRPRWTPAPAARTRSPPPSTSPIALDASRCPLAAEEALQARPRRNLHKWVSLSFPQFWEIGGYPGCDDGVVGGRSDGHRLLDEAVEQEASGL